MTAHRYRIEVVDNHVDLSAPFVGENIFLFKTMLDLTQPILSDNTYRRLGTLGDATEEHSVYQGCDREMTEVSTKPPIHWMNLKLQSEMSGRILTKEE